MSRTKLLNGELTAEQRIIAEYIEENAPDVLVEKINAGNKGIRDCWSYIYGKAKEAADGKKAIAISDKQVYGWAMHYFEEDSIKKGEDPTIKTVDIKATSKKEAGKKQVPAKDLPKKAEPKKKEDNPAQMTIFDLMGGLE